MAKFSHYFKREGYLSIYDNIQNSTDLGARYLVPDPIDRGIVFVGGFDGVTIIDITDIRNPVKVSEIPVIDASDSRPSITTNGQYLFTTHFNSSEDGVGELQSYDVSDPANPVKVGEIPTIVDHQISHTDLANDNLLAANSIRNNIAGVPDNGNGIVYFNVSNPANMIKLGYQRLTNPDENNQQFQGNGSVRDHLCTTTGYTFAVVNEVEIVDPDETRLFILADNGGNPGIVTHGEFAAEKISAHNLGVDDIIYDDVRDVLLIIGDGTSNDSPQGAITHGSIGIYDVSDILNISLIGHFLLDDYRPTNGGFIERNRSDGKTFLYTGMIALPEVRENGHSPEYLAVYDITNYLTMKLIGRTKVYEPGRDSFMQIHSPVGLQTQHGEGSLAVANWSDGVATFRCVPGPPPLRRRQTDAESERLGGRLRTQAQARSHQSNPQRIASASKNSYY